MMSNKMIDNSDDCQVVDEKPSTASVMGAVQNALQSLSEFNSNAAPISGRAPVAYIIVAACEGGSAVELPLSGDSSLSLDTLQIEFTGALGLKYRNPDTGLFRVLAPEKNKVFPPPGGWSVHHYIACCPKAPQDRPWETNSNSLTLAQVSGSATGTPMPKGINTTSLKPQPLNPNDYALPSWSLHLLIASFKRTFEANRNEYEPAQKRPILNTQSQAYNTGFSSGYGSNYANNVGYGNNTRSRPLALPTPSPAALRGKAGLGGANRGGLGGAAPQKTPKKMGEGPGHGFCKVCDKQLNSAHQVAEHYRGKKHAEKEAISKGLPVPEWAKPKERPPKPDDANNDSAAIKPAEPSS